MLYYTSECKIDRERGNKQETPQQQSAITKHGSYIKRTARNICTLVETHVWTYRALVRARACASRRSDKSRDGVIMLYVVSVGHGITAPRNKSTCCGGHIVYIALAIITCFVSVRYALQTESPQTSNRRQRQRQTRQVHGSFLSLSDHTDHSERLLFQRVFACVYITNHSHFIISLVFNVYLILLSSVSTL